MPLSFEESSGPVLDQLGYFYEGDPKLAACIQHLWEMTYDVAGGLRLLLHGETGSGKEDLAMAAHRWLSETPGKFIPINCATINPGTARAELFGAKKGSYTGATADFPGLFGLALEKEDTVFLDEVHRIPEEVRAELLRVLAAGTYRRLGDKDDTAFNGNVIAASSSNIAEMTKSERFPADLYYRLSTGGEVMVPALRDRTQEYLAALIGFGCKNWGVKPFTLEAPLHLALLKMPFPGNVRELRSILHQLSKAARFSDGVATIEQLQRIQENRVPTEPAQS